MNYEYSYQKYKLIIFFYDFQISPGDSKKQSGVQVWLRKKIQTIVRITGDNEIVIKLDQTVE